MQPFVRRHLPAIAWSLGSIVSILAVTAWSTLLGWDFSRLDLYDLFPLFGLLAFSLMWTHYVILALRAYADDAPKVERYSTITQRIVLFCLLAHPGLLLLVLYRDGYGLPPGSYKAFFGDGLAGFITVGVVAWFAFIAYEFKRWLTKTRWWRLILALNAVAMLLILVHSLSLGSHLQTGWLRPVWIGYGVVLLLVYGYLIVKDRLVSFPVSR